MMKYVGIDAGKTHWVCVLDEKRNELVPKFQIKNDKASYERLLEIIGPNAKVCIEDTGSYSLPLHNFLKERGVDIQMIKGTSSRDLRKVVKGLIKTDANDCEVLALNRLLEEVLGTEGRASVEVQKNALKGPVRLYCMHAQRRAKLKQKLNALLQKRCPELMDAFYKPVNKTVLGIIRWTTPSMWNEATAVCRELRKHGTTHFSKANVEKTLACLKNSVGVEQLCDRSMEFLIDSYLSERQFVENLKDQLAIELMQTPHATLTLLPNVNVITAAVLAGHIGDIRRFSNVKKFVNYCGFRFERDQSGDKDKTRFKVVRTNVRWVLSAIAHSWREHDEEIGKFADGLKKRGKKALVVRFAVVRKILVRLYFEMQKLAGWSLEENLEAFENAIVPPEMKKAVAYWKAEQAAKSKARDRSQGKVVLEGVAEKKGKQQTCGAIARPIAPIVPVLT